MCSFKYPTMLMVYQTIVMTVNVFTSIAQFGAPSDLVCSSRNLLEQTNTASTFCQLTGRYSNAFSRKHYPPNRCNIHVYGAVTTILVGVSICHISLGCDLALVTKSSGKLKYHHMTEVLILPLIDVIAVYMNGEIRLILPFFPRCGAATPESIFYASILPANILGTISIVFLMVTLWNLANLVSFTLFLTISLFYFTLSIE